MSSQVGGVWVGGEHNSEGEIYQTKSAVGGWVVVGENDIRSETCQARPATCASF